MAIGIVNTKYGKMQGVELTGKYEGVTVFKGVPYAKPPVGDLRWKPPVDIEPWEGVRVCDTFAPGCVQLTGTIDPNNMAPDQEDYYFEQGYFPTSEDCLYINIFTGAESADEKRPVYIWTHGGGLTNCWSYEPEWDGRELARKGVIVVQIGHRLGPFGYISLPQLTAEQGKSGNYGLMDTVKALQWVYENIEALGGDPERISVGGQSGGTWKAAALATCPKAEGHIKGLVCESWLMWMMEYYSLEESERIGTDFLGYCGIDPETPLEELRKLDASAFNVNMERALIPGDMYFDGEYIPFPTQREAFEKLGGGIDYLCGTNFGEAEVFSPKDAPEFYYGHYKAAHNTGIYYDSIIDTPEKFYAHFKDVLEDLYDKYDFENMFKVHPNANIWKLTRYLASRGLSRRFNIGAIRGVMMPRIFGMYMKHKHPESKVHTYFFKHIQPVRPEDYGTMKDPDRLLSWHSSELWYMFGSLDKGIPPARPWKPADFMIADTVSSFMANFMKNGDPNGDGLPEWPAAGDNFGYIELDEEFKSYKGLDTKLDQLIFEFTLREYPFLTKEDLS